jgi:hypothetical protein
VAVGPVFAGAVVVVAAMWWGVLRWPALEDRLFSPRARRVAGTVSRPAAPAQVVDEPHWGAPAPASDEGVVVVRVVEVALVVPRDGGVR